MKHLLLASVLSCLLFANALASGNGARLANIEIDHSTQARIEGARKVASVCLACHSLKYIKYKDLLTVGLSREEVDELREDNPLGHPLMQMMSDEMLIASFGLLPPDLSLIAKARRGGDRYVYTLFTSYHESSNGEVDNQLFPGIRMPDVFSWASLSSKDRPSIERDIQNISAFLTWTADPHADERKEMGVYVLGYLVLLSGLLYRSKRRVWKRLHKPVSRHL